MDDSETYVVFASCQNCRHVCRLELPKGESVGDAPCPHCEVWLLVGVREEEVRPRLLVGPPVPPDDRVRTIAVLDPVIARLKKGRVSGRDAEMLALELETERMKLDDTLHVYGLAG